MQPPRAKASPSQRFEGGLLLAGGLLILLECIAAMRSGLPRPWLFGSMAAFDLILAKRAFAGERPAGWSTVRLWAGLPLGLGLAAISAIPGAALTYALVGIPVLLLRRIDRRASDPDRSASRPAKDVAPPQDFVAIEQRRATRRSAWLITLIAAAILLPLGITGIVGTMSRSSLLLEASALLQGRMSLREVDLSKQASWISAVLPPGHWHEFELSAEQASNWSIVSALVDPRARVEVVIRQDWVPGVGSMEYDEFSALTRKALEDGGFLVHGTALLTNEFDIASVSEIELIDGWNHYKGHVGSFASGDRLLQYMALSLSHWYPWKGPYLSAAVMSLRLKPTPIPALSSLRDGTPHRAILVRSSSSTWGSAFPVGRVAEGCLVATAEHVVGGRRSVELIGGPGPEAVVQARPVALDHENDIALLLAPPPCAEPMAWRPTADLRPGEPLYALGFPNPHVGESTSLFVRTGLHLQAPVVDELAMYLPLAMRIDPGHSGGPVLDGSSRVVGMIVKGILSTSTSFACPSERIVELILGQYPSWDPGAGETRIESGELAYAQEELDRVLEATVLVSSHMGSVPGAVVSQDDEFAFVLSSLITTSDAKIGITETIPATRIRSDPFLGLSLLRVPRSAAPAPPIPLRAGDPHLSESVLLPTYPQYITGLGMHDDSTIAWGNIANLESGTERASVDTHEEKRTFGPVVSSSGELVGYLPQALRGGGLLPMAETREVERFLGAQPERVELRHRLDGRGGCFLEWRIKLDDPLELATKVGVRFLTGKISPAGVNAEALVRWEGSTRYAFAAAAHSGCPAGPAPIAIDVYSGERAQSWFTWLPGMGLNKFRRTETEVLLPAVSRTGGSAPSWPEVPPWDDGTGCDLDRPGSCDYACTDGSGRACITLGQFTGGYAPSESAKYLRRGCELGVACELAADQALLRDVEEADRLYAAACDRGDPGACYRLGSLAYAGWLGRPDDAGAITAFQDACRLGEIVGCDAAALVRVTGARLAPSEADLAAFESSCALGHVRSCWNLLRGVRGDPEDRSSQGDKSIWSRCERDDPSACNEHTRRIRLTNRILRSACEAGDAEACASVGESMLSGSSEIMQLNGKRYLGRACELGSKLACESWSRAGGSTPRTHRVIYPRLPSELSREPRWTIEAIRPRRAEVDDFPEEHEALERDLNLKAARWITACAEWEGRGTTLRLPPDGAPLTLRFELEDGRLVQPPEVDADPTLEPLRRCLLLSPGIRSSHLGGKGKVSITTRFLIE